MDILGKKVQENEEMVFDGEPRVCVVLNGMETYGDPVPNGILNVVLFDHGVERYRLVLHEMNDVWVISDILFTAVEKIREFILNEIFRMNIQFNSVQDLYDFVRCVTEWGSMEINNVLDDPSTLVEIVNEYRKVYNK